MIDKGHEGREFTKIRNTNSLNRKYNDIRFTVIFK